MTPDLIVPSNPMHPIHSYIQNQTVSQDELLSDINDSEIEGIILNLEEVEQKKTLLSFDNQICSINDNSGYIESIIDETKN